MAVDSANVQRIINEAIARQSGVGGCCEPIEAAFRELQAQRRVPGASLDEDLASAEHYMFARWMVCAAIVSFDQMAIMTVGYETVKKILQEGGYESLMQTTANPTAPASATSALWGLLGALAGSSDHDRCNAGAEAPTWNWNAAKYK